MEIKPGIFYCVGVGPGDPELLTVKAVHILGQCPVIAAPQTKSGEMLALQIAKGAADLSGKIILPLRFTMAREPELRRASHLEAARQIKVHLAEGRSVAMVSLGDVSLYSTCGYVANLIQAESYETVMIPGVTSFSAAAARLGLSLAAMDTPVHIIPVSGIPLSGALELPGTKVLMKCGGHEDEVKQALELHGAPERAALIANCGLENEFICTDLSHLPEERPGYYTTIIVKE